jgi:hypothetical protein
LWRAPRGRGADGVRIWNAEPVLRSCTPTPAASSIVRKTRWCSTSVQRSASARTTSRAAVTVPGIARPPSLRISLSLLRDRRTSVAAFLCQSSAESRLRAARRRHDASA